jgi:hypothetical protein
MSRHVLPVRAFQLIYPRSCPLQRFGKMTQKTSKHSTVVKPCEGPAVDYRETKIFLILKNTLKTLVQKQDLN